MGYVFITVLALTAAPAAEEIRPVYRVDLTDPITAASAGFLIEAIEEADRKEAELLILRLDTPGGYVTSTERIVQAMLAARTPIAAWVGPAGSRAASAGFIILIAADVAAMAPGTHTGAAAVIGSLFGANPEDDVGLRKAAEDLAARARSLAERRGRSIEPIVRAIREAAAYSDSEALREGIIDLEAESAEELLRKLDGRAIRRFDGSPAVLDTGGARVVVIEPGLLDRMLGLLANPWVSYLLLILGIAGIWGEISNPGMIVPGAAGAACLLLFAWSSQILDVSIGGLALILIALVLFALEVKVVSYGLLTLAGIGFLLIGSLLLFPGPIPELRLPLAAALPASVVLAAACIAAVRLAVQAQKAPVATGVEGLVGEVGTAIDRLAPSGRVFVHGEEWSAVATSGPIAAGAPVRVVAVEGLRLAVEPGGRESASPLSGSPMSPEPPPSVPT